MQPLFLGCSNPPCPSTPATFQVVDNFPPSSAAGSALAEGKVRTVEESTKVADTWNWITLKFRLAASLPPGAVLEISGEDRQFESQNVQTNRMILVQDLGNLRPHRESFASRQSELAYSFSALLLRIARQQGLVSGVAQLGHCPLLSVLEAFLTHQSTLCFPSVFLILSGR